MDFYHAQIIIRTARIHIRRSERLSFPTFVRAISNRLNETTEAVRSVLAANGFREETWTDTNIYWHERRIEMKRSR